MIWQTIACTTRKPPSRQLHVSRGKVSLVTRKPVFGVCDQVRHKSACAATEASKRLEISDIETRDILSRQRTTKALIRLAQVIILCY